MNNAEAKRRVIDEVDRLAPTLLDVSHRIHERPELCFEEHFAHDLLAGVIEDRGIGVERGAYGLDTAFDARVGAGDRPAVAVLCEYDALPGIGHACGHNIIAAAGLGAGLAAAAVAAEVGGALALMGTPAEEGGGGKEIMIRRGAFAGVGAAMMIHPANHELQTFHAIAVQRLRARYTGAAAHAAAAPEMGRNALDAAVLGYNAVAALRQHIRDDERIHGVFTDGGAKPNVVPATAAAEWYVRSATVDSLQPLKDRVTACLAGAATAAGCEVDLEWIDPVYSDMANDEALLERYVANAVELGRDPAPSSGEAKVTGSTDMGNVSQLVPSIHPMMKVAPDDVAIHTPEFADWARGDAGDAAVVDGAKAMAMTVVDCWTSGGVLAAAPGDHDRG